MHDCSTLLETVHERIAWWEPRVGAEERTILEQVLEGQFLNDGEVTHEFEQVLAERLQCRHAIAVTSGTAALFVALKAAGIGSGDEVLVPDLTFIATANAVNFCGAEPVLVDVDPFRLTLSPKEVRCSITKKTRAMIPVHLSGRAAPMKDLQEIAQEHGLVIIEDAAEAFLSRLDDRSLGTIGHVGCFSFSPMKMIQTGQGGAVVTDDDDIAHRIRLLKDQGRPKRGTGGNDIHETIGFNFKLTNVQAAIGLAQMNRVSERQERVKRHYKLYQEALSGCGAIQLLPFDVSFGECPLWVDCLAERRNDLSEWLHARGIETRCFWHPLHRQKPYRGSDADFPVTTQMSEAALWLPSAYTLDDEQIYCVCDHIREFYGA